MTAISKAWVIIADSAVDPDSPLDAQLITGLRDDLVHLREWLGASYTGGAVQDHSHDGVNSALVPIGPNFLRNGSFEAGTSGWTITQYTGGTVAINTGTPLDGAQSLAFTSTVLANGGGDAVSNEYIPVTGGNPYALNGAIQASVANVSSKMEIIWYDNTKAQISASTVYSSSNTPTTRTPVGGGDVAPANARFMRKKITGAVPSTGSATGTIYFDGLISDIPRGKLIKFSIITATNASWAPQPGTTQMFVTCIGGGGNGGAGGFTATDGGGGAGGNSGQIISGYIASPSGTYNAVVGAAGGNTSFGTAVTAVGGANGNPGSGVTGGLTNYAGGLIAPPGNTSMGGSAAGGTAAMTHWGAQLGGSGANGVSSNYCGGGGAGGGDGGNGGNGQAGTGAVGSAASANSGGGGGGGGGGTTAGGAGGAGGSGVIYVWEYA